MTGHCSRQAARPISFTGIDWWVALPKVLSRNRSLHAKRPVAPRTTSSCKGLGPKTKLGGQEGEVIEWGMQERVKLRGQKQLLNIAASLLLLQRKWGNDSRVLHS